MSRPLTGGRIPAMSGGFLCFKCGANLREVQRPITRLSHCPECFAELRCCLMCKKYTTVYHTKCTDERADPPERKDSANFCDWYSPRFGAFDPAGNSAADAARGELASLFDAGAVEPESGGTDEEAEREESPAAADGPVSAAEALFKKDD